MRDLLDSRISFFVSTNKCGSEIAKTDESVVGVSLEEKEGHGGQKQKLNIASPPENIKIEFS